MTWLSGLALVWAIADAKLSANPQDGVSVTVGRNDFNGTGANLSENVLSPQTMRARKFGKIFSYNVDGLVYAQPLILSNVNTAAGKRNLLIVATSNNQLCAFDTDQPSQKPVWHRDLGFGGIDDPSACLGKQHFKAPEPAMGHLAPQVGILSTPVIDAQSGTIYLVARVWSTITPGSAPTQLLYSISVADGKTKQQVVIGPRIVLQFHTVNYEFDIKKQVNRPGLTVVNGLVIVMWGTFLDGGSLPRTERGWVLAFDKTTLSLRGTFCTTCFGGTEAAGMIWQSGRPPVVLNDRYLFFMTGNGFKDTSIQNPQNSCDPKLPYKRSMGDYSESLVRLDTSSVSEWIKNSGVANWTPADWCQLDHDDTDLGGSGPILISTAGNVRFGTGGPPILYGGGKAGILYGLESSKLTGPNLLQWNPPGFSVIGQCVDLNDPAKLNVRSPPDTNCSPASPHQYGKNDHDMSRHIMGGPVFLPDRKTPFVSSFPGTGMLYVAPENLEVLGYRVINGLIQPGAPLKGPPSSKAGHPGGILSASAGNAADSAIIWVSQYKPCSSSDTTCLAPESAQDTVKWGVLDALDAKNLTLLWSSDRVCTPQSCDQVGYYQKFTPPTVANGRVYIPAVPSPSSGSTSYNNLGADGKIIVYGFIP